MGRRRGDGGRDGQDGMGRDTDGTACRRHEVPVDVREFVSDVRTCSPEEGRAVSAMT